MKGKRRLRSPLILAALSLGLILTFLSSLALGAVSIPLSEVVTILLGGIPQKLPWIDIIFKFRLPKALTAMLAGSALATSGLQLQTLFHNPLAGPFVLGISSGASLGVALIVLAVNLIGGSSLFSSLGILSNFGTVIAACIGATIVTSLVILAAQFVRNSIALLVLGLMFGYATSAIVSILLSLSSAEQIQTYLNWTFGSFAGVTWNQLPIFAIVVLFGMAIAWILAPKLNPLLLGNDPAQSLGISIQRLRIWILVSSSLLAGVVTAFCGPIAFLGVAVPHLCRGLFRTADHRWLVPAVGLVGAILALVADTIAQLPKNSILPLNSVTALIGTPIVIWIILKPRSLSQ
ncbi:MAG TPA: iron ABC transporter permease [Leptolyngbya sp.]|nr:iron ABC transporter permease [Leptolyngbya sp.]